jgi:hypothetical protein
MQPTGRIGTSTRIGLSLPKRIVLRFYEPRQPVRERAEAVRS